MFVLAWNGSGLWSKLGNHAPAELSNGGLYIFKSVTTFEFSLQIRKRWEIEAVALGRSRPGERMGDIIQPDPTPHP